MMRILLYCLVTVAFTCNLQARRTSEGHVHHPLEAIPEGERTIIRGIPGNDERPGLVNTMRSLVTTRRDAHEKAHGCQKVRIVVNRNLHDDLKGNPIFREGYIFDDAYVRFSKGDDKPDRMCGGHGLALKIILPESLQRKVPNLPGEQIFRAPELYRSLDILTINQIKESIFDTAADYPVFLAAGQRMAAALRDGQNQAQAWDVFQTIYNPDGKRRSREIRLMERLQQHETRNPYWEPYFSWTAWSYQKGNRVTAVKYRIQPCRMPQGQYQFPEGVSTNDDNFVRKVLIHESKLQEHRLCLSAQVWKNNMREDGSSIESATTPWSEEKSPYRPLATIVIGRKEPRQEILSDAFCEMLAFNPRRAPRGNQGIGGINRVRGEVYAGTHTQKALNLDERPIQLVGRRR